MKSNQEEKYFLNIHHRSISVKEGNAGQLEQDKSYGHLYLSLQVNSNKPEFFGRYPAEDSLLIGKSEIKTDKEEVTHSGIEKISKQTGKDYGYTVRIKLNEEQYIKALSYAREQAKLKDGQYIIGLNDCVDFVQSVYNAAGLPLYFTTAYSRQQLKDFDTLASSKMSIKYGSRDTIKQHLSITEGVSREQLAKALNIGIDKIRPSSPVIDISLQSYDSLLPKFKITLDDSDILPAELFTKELIDINELGLSATELLERKMAGLQLSEEAKSTKIKLLQNKAQEFCNAHVQKLQNICNKFTLNKIEEGKNNAQELSQKAKAEVAAYYEQVNAELKEAQDKLTSELVSESKAKSALVKAMISSQHSGHNEPCGGGTVVIDNQDILAKKQQALNALISQYEAKGKTDVAAINQKYKVMHEDHEREGLHSIDGAKKLTQGHIGGFINNLKIEVAKAKEAIEKGEDVDIDKFILNFELKYIGHGDAVEHALSNLEHTTIVKALFGIEYDNPILNHPELIKNMQTKFGSGIVDKLINFGTQFTSSEDKSMLEDICNEPNSLETVSLLMGLDTIDSVTYH